jgi:hypothetical protein
MFYSNTLSQVFPDQNVFLHPFYMQHPQFMQFVMRNNTTGHVEEESKVQGHFQNNYYQIHSAFPRQVKLVVLQKEEAEKEKYSVANANSFYIKGGSNTETQISDSNSDSELSNHKPKFTVTKHIYSNELMTEFNNHPKLKKINSSYHLKRKISTKLQNDLKDSINSLLVQINAELNLKLPLMTHNSKEFRENVKNEFLKLYGNQTVAKYVCEDVLVERKQPTSVGLENNKKLIAKIEELYLIYSECSPLKKLFTLFHKTLVKDFYAQFLNSSRYTKCEEKDIMKYAQKLDSIEFSRETKKIFSEIYALKYDGIAKSYFT